MKIPVYQNKFGNKIWGHQTLEMRVEQILNYSETTDIPYGEGFRFWETRVSALIELIALYFTNTLIRGKPRAFLKAFGNIKSLSFFVNYNMLGEFIISNKV